MFSLEKKYTYAIVGASNDPDKYGNKVMRDLSDAGFKVIPINPKERIILDKKCYPSITIVPEKIDVVVFVVSPKVTENILREVQQKDIRKVWMQPGSASEKAISFCEKKNIDLMHDVCVMMNH